MVLEGIKIIMYMMVLINNLKLLIIRENLYIIYYIYIYSNY